MVYLIQENKDALYQIRIQYELHNNRAIRFKQIDKNIFIQYDIEKKENYLRTFVKLKKKVV